MLTRVFNFEPLSKKLCQIVYILKYEKPTMTDTPISSHDDTCDVTSPIRLLNGDLAHPSNDSRALLRYWNATRRDLELPRRSDIDPRGIAGMLSKAFILEQIAPGVARFRVAGTQLSDLLGMDVRGMPLSAILLPDAREALAASLEELFDMPGILRAALVSPSGFRRPELEAELLILPLRDERGEVNRAIGCLMARGEIGKAPRRFAFRHVRVDPVSVVKTLKTVSSKTKHISKHEPTPLPELAQDQRPRFAPMKPNQPSYLRLVISD
ncbi:MAG: PAS domain-containing protein [Pseudomonadota bacterium]